MTGQVMIVTGANCGLGYEVARYLCEGGNDVILACRNEEKANRAIEKIKRQNPNALATFLSLDLSDMKSVHKFVEDFHATEKKLNVLINNAGTASSSKDTKRQFTKDNFEQTIGVNHLGHFLLTNLLLEDLKKSGADGGVARVLTVTSVDHDAERNKSKHLQALDLEDLLLAKEGAYTGLQAYKNSKAANIMFTIELARRLEGSGVTANCVCPGNVPSTDLLRSAPGTQKIYNRYIKHGMLRFAKMTRTVQQGANAISTVATDDKYKEVSGKYIKDGAEAKSSAESVDEEKQKKLWELSGGYTALEGYELIEAPEPPKEEEPKKEEPKKEGEEGAAEKKEGEGAGDVKVDDEKKEEEKEVKEEEKKEAVEEEKKEVEEKKEEDSKETKVETPAENKEEEKKE